MLVIRVCTACGGRVRTTLPAVGPGPCPYCKARPDAGPEFDDWLAPHGAERAAWLMGRLTEAAGILLFAAMLVGHERLSLSWLGAGVAGAILACLVVSIGWMVRLGRPGEAIGQNVAALLLLYGLVLYGFAAFDPLDALGASAMLILAVFGIVLIDADHGALRDRLIPAWVAGWVLVGCFVIGYANHAVQARRAAARAAALLLSARNLEQTRKTQAALDSYRQIVRDYPNTSAAKAARERVNAIVAN